jgi:hypothetical protein
MADAPDNPGPPNVTLSTGLPETVLAPAPPEALAALESARAANRSIREQRDAVARVVAAYPRLLEGWAALGQLATEPVESYAYFRVGYHRGLDALRGSGWRGSGYVRWRHPGNRGFLESVDGLRVQAERIGETDEAARLADFLRQLDPDRERRGSS